MITSVATELNKKEEGMNQHASVAILPLVNMSAGLEQEYFSDGISEDIIDALTGIEGIKLISRGSSFGLKDQKMSIPEVGTYFNVEFVVSGTLRRIGSKVRMRIYLHNAETEEEIWSQSYDQKIADIFDIEEDIVDSLCKNLLDEKGYGKLKKPVFVPATRNFKAFDHYLQGLFFHNKWSLQDLSKAVTCYERAIKKEPDYALAYSMMSNAYTRLSFAGGYTRPVKSYEEAKVAANKSIEIDPDYYRSYIALSYVYLYQKYDWEQALMMVNKALKLHEMSTKAMVAKSLYYTIKGNFVESRKLLKSALERDPLSFMAKRAQADNYFLEGKYDTAIKLYDELIELDPYHEKVLEYKGWAVVMQGKLDEAIEMFKSIDMQTALALKSFSQLGYAYAIKGDRVNAEKYLTEIERSSVINKGLTYALDFAVIFTGLGMFDRAMDHLEEAVDNKRSAIIFLKVNPIWDPMRGHPRFKELLKRLRLN
ncbi:tetratricopeptide repeat protein [Marinoscillum sp. MHG1-6]|uniref:tetratricopeptide repeat protein n=1 Tax=Marinoscillum sp. MHG1-6 TaxID=2959627 RepID=UPI0021575BAE|nr:tetratricopeptide repeat protein [Marinoscillum sp. MHG1-6]